MKLKDITPKEDLCAIGACPAVFESDRDTYVVVGKILPHSETSVLIPGRVGEDEIAVEVPKRILGKLIASTRSRRATRDR